VLVRVGREQVANTVQVTVALNKPQTDCPAPPHTTLHLPQALASGAGGGAALSRLSGGLPPAVPLRSLALALAYADGGLGRAGAAARAAALRGGGAGAEAAAERWEPVVDPALVQGCWRQLEAAWAASRVTSAGALRRYAATGALGGGGTEGEEGGTAGLLGAYLQLHGVPPPHALRQAGEGVAAMLREAALPGAHAAAAAAAAMLASLHGVELAAAQALAAALVQ
jgi:hypothetical protein